MSPFLTTFLPILGTFLNYLEFHSSPSVLLTHLCVPLPQLVQLHGFIRKSSRPMLLRPLHSLGGLNEPDGHQAVVLLNLACPGIKGQLANATQPLNHDYRWLLVNGEEMSLTEERTLELFSDIPILQMSEVYYATTGPSAPTIRRVYRHSPAAPLIRETLFEESPLMEEGNGTSWKRSAELSTTAVMARLGPPGLSGAVVQVALVITDNDTLNHLDDFMDIHVDTITKINYLITEELMRFLNATAEYQQVSSWGNPDRATGQFDGMVGKLQRREAVLGACAIFLTLERMPFVQYVSMTSGTRMSILFRAPKLSTTDNIFLLPFRAVSCCCELNGSRRRNIPALPGHLDHHHSVRGAVRARPEGVLPGRGE